MIFELRLLGGVSLFADGRLVSGAAVQPRRLAVLAVLAEACPAAVTRDRLIGLIWPEQNEAGARRLLTQSLYELRRELGGVVVASGRDVALAPDAFQVDLIDLRSALRDGDGERAADLYRGPFLGGFNLRDAGEFERWASGARDGIQRDVCRSLEASVARRETEGDVRAAAQVADRLLDISPYDAAAVIRAMDLFDRAGDPGSSARVAETYRRRMREDLDLEPDARVLDRRSELPAAAPFATSVGEEPIDRVPRSPSAVGTAYRRRVPIARGLIAVACLAAGVIVAARFIGGRQRVPARTIALASFEARGDANAARVASALTSMLVANLDGAASVRIDTSRAGGVKDGSSWGALRGIVVSNGDNVRVDAELEINRPKGQRVHVTTVGASDSLIVLAERLALELLPNLYPELGPRARPEVVVRLRDVATARRYLDGESAMSRAAFDTAYDELRAATDRDTSAAFLWYRRAIAAEEAHRADDADRSAKIADARSGALGPGTRDLIHAYAVWRSGDIQGADSLYRRILAARPLDAEAWFQFAEVAYHGGPLIGRPLNVARDAWRRAISLDSNNFPAIMHAVRLEAGAGDVQTLRVLLSRAERLGARDPLLSETRAIAAAAGSVDGGATERLAARMPDASVQFVHAIVAGLVERPDVAQKVATALIARHRPEAVRSQGYSALAHLAIARGDLDAASTMLDSVARVDPVGAASARGYFAALPFLPESASAVLGARGSSNGAQAASSAAPLYLEMTADDAASSLIARYNASLLAIRSGESVDQGLGCSAFAEQAERNLCFDLEHGIVAERLTDAGKPADALRELEAMTTTVPYQLAGRSVYFARTRERFLHAQSLERLERLDEAYAWYAATPHVARLDYIYLAPTHLARGRIRERQGDLSGAARHYRRAIELWSAAPDPGGIRREAEEGLRRVSPVE